MSVPPFIRAVAFLTLVVCAQAARAGSDVTELSPSQKLAPKFATLDDHWLDASSFLEKKHGFIPIPLIVTEPAVGYGGGVALMFLSAPIPHAEDGLGFPDVTMVGGLATENGTWAAFAGDMRHWFDHHLQTMIGVIDASANLDFYGLGSSQAFGGKPLRYTIEPKGVTARVKYRFGDSRLWLGLNYAFATTDISLSQSPAFFGATAQHYKSNVGGFTPSLTFDTRDNFFTPTRGTYVEASAGIFDPAFGADQDFQRGDFVAMQFTPLASNLFLGLRAEVAASSRNTPFYLRPYISLRGASAMQYQGQEVAQIEAEVRWQFWQRFSVVGFVGSGMAWNHFDRFSNKNGIITGGIGFRYELARAYGLHVGVDIAKGPDNNAAFYIQIGSAWARP